MLRAAILMLTTLTCVTACADVNRSTVLVAGPEQSLCVPIPAELIYEGDMVQVRVIERDPFQNDLLGHTNVIVDSAMLDAGRVELRTGWVQSLSLGFVPCDEEGDAEL